MHQYGHKPLAPQLVLKVAAGHESMPQLTGTDLNKYFGPGTGTRCWIGVKIYKATNGNHRWWAGIAYRACTPNGTFLDAPDMSPESMPSVASHNTPITKLLQILYFMSTLQHLLILSNLRQTILQLST